jgi:hypothetical protein
MNIRRIILQEIKDFDWIKNVPPNFEDVNLRVGDMFRVPTLNPDGSTFSIVTIIDIGLRGNEPITYRRESGMGQLQQRNLVDSKANFIRRIIKNKWKPFYHNRGFKLNESEDFDWIQDTNPIEDIDLKDMAHVDTIKEGDKLEITGEYDGIEFHNEPCEVICVGSCSGHPYSSSVKWNAWEHQTLVSFERGFYSQETDEETHCGPNIDTEIKCKCREVEGVVGHDGEQYMVGTCWWINIPSLDEVVRVSDYSVVEESEDFDWIKDQTPMELEDPKNWVGRTFGYGESIIGLMHPGEINNGDDKETYTIMSISDREVGNNLMLRKNHPRFGTTGDIGTTVNTLRRMIKSGDWVWVD